MSVTSESRPSTTLRRHETIGHHLATIDEARKRPIEQSSPNCQAMANQIDMLKYLLNAERQRNEQRKANYNIIKNELTQLQDEYLHLQADMVDMMKLSKEIKLKKQTELDSVKNLLNDKDKLIDELKESIEMNSTDNIRAMFETKLKQQCHSFDQERAQYYDNIQKLEKQISLERTKQLTIQDDNDKKMQATMKQCETREINLRQTIEKLRKDIDNIHNEPKWAQVKKLKEDNYKQQSQLEHIKLVMSENKKRYDRLRVKLENLVTDQESVDCKNHIELERLHHEVVQYKQMLSSAKSNLEEQCDINSNLRTAYEKAEKKIVALETMMTSREQSFEAHLNKYKKHYENSKSELSNQCDLLLESIRQLELELNKKRQQVEMLEASTADEIAIIVQRNENKFKKLLQEQDELTEANKVLKTQADGLLRINQEYVARAEEYRRVTEERERVVMVMREENLKLTADLGAYEAKHNDISRVDEENRRLSKLIEEIKLELEASQILNREYKTKTDGLEKEIEDIRKEHKSNQESDLHTTKALQNELDKVKQDHEALRNHYDSKQSELTQSLNKYRKNAFKLRKYIDHMKQIHGHICNPSKCGFVVSPKKNLADVSEDSVCKYRKSPHPKVLSANTGPYHSNISSPGKENEYCGHLHIKRFAKRALIGPGEKEALKPSSPQSQSSTPRSIRLVKKRVVQHETTI